MDIELRRHIEARRAAHAKRDSETKFEDLIVKLGPLTKAMRDQARWIAVNHLYPAWQVYADEIERVMEFAKLQGQLDRYWPRLTARVAQRDSALDELRVASHLHSVGFKIMEWEPLGQDQREGEFLICGPSGVRVFVEVKGPRWEGELNDKEIAAGRTKHPKDLHLEARVIAPWKQIQLVVEKAYEKFSAAATNLLIVVGHRGFVSLEHGTAMHANGALYNARQKGCFIDESYRNLGGVSIFWMSNDMKYELRLFRNDYALKPLPDDFT